MRERISGREGRESQRRTDGLFKASCITESSNEAMVSFDVRCCQRPAPRFAKCNRRTEGFYSLGRRAFGQQVHPLPAKVFDIGQIVRGHGFH